MNIEKYNNYVQELIKKSNNTNYPQKYDGANPQYLLPIAERLHNNCYCYSLGMKISSPARRLFRPGWISNYSFYKSSPKENGCLFPSYEGKEHFINAILNDIEVLKIVHEVISTNPDVSTLNAFISRCKDNQSSIVVAGAGNLTKGNFHFARSDLEGFSHKQGWEMPPTQISDVEEAFHQYKCEPVLILRLKNKTR